MRIALDAMGGDYAPKNTVEGAVLALKEYPYIEKLFLVGDAVATKESVIQFPSLRASRGEGGVSIAKVLGILSQHCDQRVTLLLSHPVVSVSIESACLLESGQGGPFDAFVLPDKTCTEL